MSKKKPRRLPAAASSFDQARDEMFSHILRCGVIEALPEHQKEWFDDTMQYLTDRYPDLSEEEVAGCARWASGTASPYSVAPSPSVRRAQAQSRSDLYPVTAYTLAPRQPPRGVSVSGSPTASANPR